MHLLYERIFLTLEKAGFMLYNIDFTASALVVLIFMLVHYLRNGRSAVRASRVFPIFIAYIFVLGILDIVDVVLLSNPDTPQNACLAITTAYMALETYSAALLLYFIPLWSGKHPAKKSHTCAL